MRVMLVFLVKHAHMLVGLVACLLYIMESVECMCQLPRGQIVQRMCNLTNKNKSRPFIGQVDVSRILSSATSVLVYMSVQAWAHGRAPRFLCLTRPCGYFCWICSSRTTTCGGIVFWGHRLNRCFKGSHSKVSLADNGSDHTCRSTEVVHVTAAIDAITSFYSSTTALTNAKLHLHNYLFYLLVF